MSKFYFARILKSNLIFDFLRIKQEINHDIEAPPSKQKTFSTQLPIIYENHVLTIQKGIFFEASRFLVVS